MHELASTSKAPQIMNIPQDTVAATDMASAPNMAVEPCVAVATGMNASMNGPGANIQQNKINTNGMHAQHVQAPFATQKPPVKKKHVVDEVERGYMNNRDKKTTSRF